LSGFWGKVHGYLTNKHKQLIQLLDLIDLHKIFPRRLWDSLFGRPITNRHAFVKAFIARIIFNLQTTDALIERLKVDSALRSICGFDCRANKLPSASSFSRAFAELSHLNIADKIHEYMIKEHCSEELYEYSAIDASAISVSEKATKKKSKKQKAKTTVAQQLGMNTADIISSLSTICDFGGKNDSNGNKSTWKGYKLHTVVNEYNIPVASLVTSASVHDSLCAIPLIRITEERVDSLYYLGDKGYDAKAIRTEVDNHGKVALIDFNRRGNATDTRSFDEQQKKRYGNRSFVESSYAQLKLNYLPSYILFRGINKIKALLNLALSVIAGVQIMKYA